MTTEDWWRTDAPDPADPYRLVDPDEDSDEAAAFWEAAACDPLRVAPTPPHTAGAGAADDVVREAAQTAAAQFADVFRHALAEQPITTWPTIAKQEAESRGYNFSWLQLQRNIPAALVVFLVPLPFSGQAAAFAVRDMADALGPLAPIGFAIPIGWIALCFAGNLATWFRRTRLGWVLTYLPAWALGSGITLSIWRPAVRFLTGV